MCKQKNSFDKFLEAMDEVEDELQCPGGLQKIQENLLRGAIKLDPENARKVLLQMLYANYMPKISENIQ